MLFALLAQVSADPAIVVTASLLPQRRSEAIGSVASFDEATVAVLGEPFALDYIRLAPGASVSVSGAQGSQAQVRIRGAEANQSLLFVDGIAFNDVASDNQARFETLPADGLGRIEVIRGPQSALWGSEALGGVIALDTPDPLGTRRGSAAIDYGSPDSSRGAAAFVSGGDRLGLSGSASWSRSDGIDALGGGSGDRDGYENYGASLKTVARPGGDGEIGAVGRYIHHANALDGTDPATFLRADTAENSVAETFAGRAWARVGISEDARWSVGLEAQYLTSENRNGNGAVRTNDSIGARTRFSVQAVRRIGTGRSGHALIAKIEREDEDYDTRDLLFGGGGDVDYGRRRTAFVGEWSARWSDLLTTDLAVRHDDFNRFEDETTVRAGAVLSIGAGLALTGSYGEGIAQPGFAELFGYAPGSAFVGNADLTPEKSRGYEVGVRWADGTTSLELVGFSNNLTDEIVYAQLTPSPAGAYTYVNSGGKSRRRGIELSGIWRPREELTLGGNYTYLDAREPGSGTTDPLREIRRPRHSANLYGAWTGGPISLGASLAFVGKRRDMDFDTYSDVTLGDYLLAGARVGYAVTPALEAFARVDNLGDADYQDVVGYATPGRTAHVGLRVRLGG